MKTFRNIKLTTIGILLLSLSSLNSQVITVGTTGDYLTLNAASSFINPGDTVIVQNEVFTNGSQYMGDIKGTAAEPIVIIAETQHGAIFQGGSSAIHFVDCEYMELNGFIFEQQTSNGVNIDDGGDYTTPAKFITIRNCIFRDMNVTGNHDLLKMSGVNDFLIENCEFLDGSTGGSGIDFVGCHNGSVQDCIFDTAGSSGVQIKGGSQYITVQRNVLKNMGQRALNLGGNTDLIYFRPPLPNPIVGAFEAADIDVFSNIFINSRAPLAFVGSVRIKVFNNTIYKPDNWVMRILQETNESGFLPCGNNEFRNNIIYQETDLTEVNIGSNTLPETFIFTNNVWFNKASNSWAPVLPVVDSNQVIADPLFVDDINENFQLMTTSPAIEAGKVLADPTTDFSKVSYYNPPSSGAYEGNTSARNDLATIVNVPAANYIGSLQNGSWSPNNQKLMCTNWENGYNLYPANIFIIDLSDFSFISLTTDGESNINMPGLTWSPLLNQVIFSSEHNGNGDQVHTMFPNGSPNSAVKITPWTDRLCWEPGFSNDGEWIVYEAHYTSNIDTGIIETYKIDGTQGPIQLTTNSTDARQPSWSPIGDKIVYQVIENGTWDIWTMDTDGTNKQNITASDAGDKTDASFSPNGEWIVYSSSNGVLNFANIFIKNLSTNQLIQVTDYVNGYDGAPSWGTNNKIVFESTIGDPDISSGATLWTIEAPVNGTCLITNILQNVIIDSDTTIYAFQQIKLDNVTVNNPYELILKSQETFILDNCDVEQGAKLTIIYEDGCE